MDVFKAESVNVSFGMTDGNNNVEFVGKNAVVKSLEITHQPPRDKVMFRNGKECDIAMPLEPIEVTIEFLIPAGDFTQFFNDGCSTAKISKKKVEDCSVRELLFAIRYKLNSTKRGSKS